MVMYEDGTQMEFSREAGDSDAVFSGPGKRILKLTQAKETIIITEEFLNWLQISYNIILIGLE